MCGVRDLISMLYFSNDRLGKYSHDVVVFDRFKNIWRTKNERDFEVLVLENSKYEPNIIRLKTKNARTADTHLLYQLYRFTYYNPTT